MQFGERSEGKWSRLTCSYPCALQLYKLPPTEIISLQEFEEMAEKRLRRNIIAIVVMCALKFLILLVLQAVESKRVKLIHEGNHRNSDEYSSQMKTVVKASDTIPFGVSCPDSMS